MTAIGIAVPTAAPFDVVGIGVNAVDHLCTVATFPTFDSKQTFAAYDCQPGGQVATALVAQTRAPLVAVTLGAQGVIARTATETLRVPGYAVATVDTTGAGDVFRAGFIYGLLQGWTLAPTLRFANAAAGLKCMRLGGRPGIPTVAAARALAGTKEES